LGVADDLHPVLLEDLVRVALRLGEVEQVAEPGAPAALHAHPQADLLRVELLLLDDGLDLSRGRLRQEDPVLGLGCGFGRGRHALDLRCDTPAAAWNVWQGASETPDRSLWAGDFIGGLPAGHQWPEAACRCSTGRPYLAW